MTSFLTTIGRRARAAASVLALATTEQKNAFLVTLASSLQRAQRRILGANARDVNRQGADHPLADRLRLTPTRLDAMRKSLLAVKRIPDPVGEVIEQQRRRNGLNISRVRVPIGVLGVIYESRPNVTVEVASLALKAGNAIILKGGREADETNRVLVSLIQDALERHRLPRHAVQFLDASKRHLVRRLLRLNEYVDLIVPRGGRGLIRFVRDHASVPVLETGAGVCHTYVERSADIDRAVTIIENAKTQRPTVCNAIDTLILDSSIATRLLAALAARLASHGVVIKADAASERILRRQYPARLLRRARASDYGREFLSLTLSVKTVRNLTEAIAFIQAKSSGHSEAILTNNRRAGERFLAEVDAAAVYLNTSTRFTDGYEFGLGAEVGVSTQKLHARGPVGLRELTSSKWVIRSSWRVRA